MAHYQTFQSNAAEVPLMRKWILRALVISLLLHAGLLVFFRTTELQNFGYTGEERLAPPMHVLRQVQIPELMEEVKLDIKEKPQAVKPIAIPNEKPQIEDVHVLPTAPEVTKPIVSEKPTATLSGFDAASDRIEAMSLNALEKQLTGMAGSLMDRTARAKGQPVIKIPTGPKGGDGGIGREAGIPGRATLDEALARSTGPATGKPIAMRGGALFEHGQAALLPAAVDDLQKLAELIKRNSKSIFIISGHTDHTGTYESNLILSQQRADAVRDWLVSQLGIDPTRITTIGKADTEAFPELGADKSIDEQAPNRRVEIVIKTNRK